MKNEARVVVETGYGKFLLPEGTSADAISVLTKAIQITEHYCSNKRIAISNPYAVSSSREKAIQIHLIDESRILWFLDKRNKDTHQEYDVIINEVKNRLASKKQKLAVIFEDKNYTIKNIYEYKNLSDPETDPNKIIDNIVNEALTGECQEEEE